MLDSEEYEHFVYTFKQFKDRLGNDQNCATLFRECLGTDISRILHSNYGAALGSFTEEQILTNITKHCVNQQTLQAEARPRAESLILPGFLQVKGQWPQDKVHQLPTPVEWLQWKMILTLFLNGLQDTDLQQELLDLDMCLRIATARETAKRFQDTINTPTQAVGKISVYKEDLKIIKIPKDCCIRCGKKKHLDKAFYPAK